VGTRSDGVRKSHSGLQGQSTMEGRVSGKSAADKLTQPLPSPPPPKKNKLQITANPKTHFLDPETGPQALRTLLLLLLFFLGLLLLSDFQSTKAFLFQNRPSLHFAYRLKTIFSTIAP